MCPEPEFNSEWKDVNYARNAFVLPAIIRYRLKNIVKFVAAAKVAGLDSRYAESKSKEVYRQTSKSEEEGATFRVAKSESLILL
jgi:hypothetical protein